MALVALHEVCAMMRLRGLAPDPTLASLTVLAGFMLLIPLPG